MKARNPDTGEVVELVNGKWVPATPDEGFFGGLAAGAKQAFGNIGMGLADLALTKTERQAADAQGGFRNFYTPDEFAHVQAHQPTATAIGGTAPYLGASLGAAALTGGAGFLPTLLAQAGAAGAVGASQPGTWDERLIRGGTDAALAAAGEGVGKLVGKVFAPGMRPVTGSGANHIAEAEKLGFQVLPSTEMAPGAHHLRQTIEGGLEATPGGGAVLGKVTQNNQARLERIAAEAIGENADAPTDEVLAAARKRIGSDFDATLPKGKLLNTVAEDLAKLDEIESEFIAPWVRPGEGVIGDLIAKARNAIQAGEIDAGVLKTQQSALGKQGHQALRGPMSNPELGHGLLDVRSLLLDIAKRELPAPDAARLTQARNQYRILSSLESGTIIDPVTGNVSAAKLANYLQRRDRGGFAEGKDKSPLYEATRFLGRLQRPLNSPGTAERMFLSNTFRGVGGLTGAALGSGGGDPNELLGGAAGAGIGAFALPAMLAAGYKSPAMRSWLTRQAHPLEALATRFGGRVAAIAARGASENDANPRRSVQSQQDIAEGLLEMRQGRR